MSTSPTIEPSILTLCCSSLDSGRLLWTDPDGSRHGYEPDVAAATAAAAGLELRWIFRQWSDFAGALDRRECDAIWCGSAITPERRRVFAYTRPYAVFDESVVVRPESTVSSPEELGGQRVLAIAGSTNMQLAETFSGAVLVPFKGDTDDVLGDMLDMLRTGQVDAVVDDDVCFIEPDPDPPGRLHCSHSKPLGWRMPKGRKRTCWIARRCDRTSRSQADLGRMVVSPQVPVLTV